jgi:predicted DNA binding protein
MVQACLRIELSERQWKGSVSRTHDDVAFQLLGTVLDGDDAVEMVSVSGPHVGESLSTIDDHPDVAAFDTVDRCDGSATVQLRTLEPLVIRAAARAGTPLSYPATVNRGWLATTIIGTREGISSLGEQLRTDGLDFEVASIHSDHDVSHVLTDRQEEVLFAAIERGYYESPRECTLTAVAKELDIAKSTCSAILQRAEESIVEYFCSQQQQSKQVPAGEANVPVESFSERAPSRRSDS